MVFPSRTRTFRTTCLYEFNNLGRNKTAARSGCDYTATLPILKQPMKLTRTIKQASLALASFSIISLSAMAADEKANADNTALNQRDRSGETATSGDQSNTSGDLKITQAIRQALMKDGELSTTAKNIKVITANGQVTLRGPVNNAQEKAKVDQIAHSAGGGAKIVDELDVKK